IPNDQGKHPGLAGALIGVSNNKLIIAGGANFPNGMPWEGGKKTFQQKIYIADLSSGDQLRWKTQHPLLPIPLAYAANVGFQNGFISIGGENQDGPIPSVSYWVWDEENTRLVENKFPDLPVPITNAAAAIFHNRL